MIEPINLLTAILNFSNSITQRIFRQNITKQDLEDMITRYEFIQQSQKEKIYIVLKENQELNYNETDNKIYIKNNKIGEYEFRQSIINNICQKFNIKPHVEPNNDKQKKYQNIVNKW